MAQYLSPLFYLGFSVSILLLIKGARNWLLYRQQRNLSKQEDAKLKGLLQKYSQELENKSTREDILHDFREIDPSGKIPIHTVLRKAESLQHQDEMRHTARLKNAVEQRYHQIIDEVFLLINVAPPVGMSFTILGLMAVLIKQSWGLDQMAMLGDIGTALSTTFFSTLILILQIFLRSSIQYQIKDQCDRGIKFIELYNGSGGRDARKYNK